MTLTLPAPPRPRINELLGRFSETRLLVVGDLMLDRYLMGEVERISPEAPVPVVNVAEERDVPGGAANVAANVAALGAACRLVGAVGEDDAGKALLEVIAAHEIPTDEIVHVADRPTTTKTRILAQGQQVVRIDREVTTSLPARHRDTVITFALDALAECDALILEDYDKGVLDPDLIALLIAEARKQGIPIVADPKARHFFAYAGATVFKPNRRELEHAFANRAGDVESELPAARALLQVDHLLVTLGSEGMALISAGEAPKNAPGIPRAVFDVSGAGDTVSAWLASALAAGATIAEAAWLANVAASVKVGKRGTATVSQAEVLAELDGR